jgi:D-apiose dehydrogenase
VVLRFALLGTGFWSRFQLAGWRELDGVECVALYNRTRSKAEALAARYGVSAVYDDVEELLRRERLDFLDVMTGAAANPTFVQLAAVHRLPVIVQKPMALDLKTAEGMVETCRRAGIPLLVHENWRWQRPIRQVKQILDGGRVGRPFRAHILYANSYPVFENQPYLREQERFILIDMGSHILDVARYLFGEARTLYCQTARVNPGIRGEDVATVVMEMSDGGEVTRAVTVLCSLSYASRMEHDRYNETYITIECTGGTVELGPDYWVRVTTRDGTLSVRYLPEHYPWATPEFAVVHASIVPCLRDLLCALQTGQPVATSGEDNLKTMRLVFAAYESAETGHVIALSGRVST